MPNDAFVIDGYAFRTMPRSNAPDEADRKEEDLHFAARDTLEQLRKEFGVSNAAREICALHQIKDMQTWLMFLYPHVARYYGVSHDALWQAWSKHYMPTMIKDLQEESNDG